MVKVIFGIYRNIKQNVKFLVTIYHAFVNGFLKKPENGQLVMNRGGQPCRCTEQILVGLSFCMSFFKLYVHCYSVHHSKLINIQRIQTIWIISL